MGTLWLEPSNTNNMSDGTSCALLDLADATVRPDIAEARFSRDSSWSACEKLVFDLSILNMFVDDVSDHARQIQGALKK